MKQKKSNCYQNCNVLHTQTYTDLLPDLDVNTHNWQERLPERFFDIAGFLFWNKKNPNNIMDLQQFDIKWQNREYAWIHNFYFTLYHYHPYLFWLLTKCFVFVINRCMVNPCNAWSGNLRSQMRTVLSSPPVYIHFPSSWKPTLVTFFWMPS